MTAKMQLRSHCWVEVALLAFPPRAGAARAILGNSISRAKASQAVAKGASTHSSEGGPKGWSGLRTRDPHYKLHPPCVWGRGGEEYHRTGGVVCKCVGGGRLRFRPRVETFTSGLRPWILFHTPHLSYKGTETKTSQIDGCFFARLRSQMVVANGPGDI